MPSRRTYQVKEVAELSGLTIRALHHYDAIALLTPSARSGAGYRLYADDDLMRLQQILIGRELGLSLEEIRRLRRLGERRHDWCETDPRAIPRSESSFLARLRNPVTQESGRQYKSFPSILNATTIFLLILSI